MKHLWILLSLLILPLLLFSSSSLSLFNNNSSFICDEDAGVISTQSDTQFFIDDQQADIILLDVDGAVGDQFFCVLTDENGIIEYIYSDYQVTIESTEIGKSYLYHLALAYETQIPSIGDHYLDINGCHDYSKPIEITKESLFNANQQICASPDRVVHFDLEDCRSYIGSSDMDYSEFVATYPDQSSCADYKILGDFLYRENPQDNKHSCTPGIEGGVAMCVMSMESCEFIPDHEQAIRFEVEVIPEEGEEVYFSGFQFYEQSPETFIWIFGDVGPNNYPLYYGLRILKNGEEVFLEENIKTEAEWNLEFFDLTKNDAFLVQDSCVFSFELLPYCWVGNGSPMAVWDIDEISLLSCCELCDIEAANIFSENGAILCDNSGQSQDIEIDVQGGTGDNSMVVIVDEFSNIMAFQEDLILDPQMIDSDAIIVQHISYTGELQGLEIGANLSDLVGCYALSNALVFIKLIPEGGDLSSTEETNICSGDGFTDVINFQVSGEMGDNSFFLITNELGFVTDISLDSQYDFEGTEAGVCYVYHVSAFGDLAGLGIGVSIDELVGCFELSNALQINKEYVQGGTISTTDNTDICSGDGELDIVSFELTGAVGNYGLWIITDPSGGIVRSSTQADINFEGVPTGNCMTRYVSFIEEPEIPNFGDDIFSLEGCYALSNPIEVVKTEVNGGVLLTDDDLYQCTNPIDGLSFTVSLSNVFGLDSMFILTDTLGEIVDIFDSSIKDFLLIQEGVFNLWHIGTDGNVSVEIGDNINDLKGCFDLSESLFIENYHVAGGSISTDDSTIICDSPGAINEFNFELHGNIGNFSQWLVTTVTGEILSISDTSAIEIINSDLDVCIVVHLSAYEEDLSLAIGMNINNIISCHDISNPIIISKNQVVPAIISTQDSTTYCLAEGEIIEFQVDIMAFDLGSGLLLVTDTSGMILDTFESNTVLIEEGFDQCQIWHLTFDDLIIGAEPGFNLNQIAGCFGLSNSIIITKDTGGAASISTSNITTICAGDGIIEPIVIDVQNASGPSEIFFVTDTDQNVLYTQESNTFDFESAEAGSCLIWHFSYDSGVDIDLITNLNSLNECSALSNAVEIIKESSIAGAISVIGSKTVCLTDDNSNIVQFDLVGGQSENELWILTDTSGLILDLASSAMFDFSNRSRGQYLVWHIGFFSGVSGAVVGSNINDLAGCFDLSNSVNIEVVDPVGGFAFPTSPTEYCVIDSIPDTLTLSVIDIVANSSLWILTDTTGIVIDVSEQSEFVLDMNSPQSCLAWHVASSDPSISIDIGTSIEDLVFCFDLSNSVSLTKYINDGGQLTTINGSETIDICVSDSEADTIFLLVNNDMGNNYSYIITDENNDIMFTSEEPEIIIPADEEMGVFKVWGLSYEGIDTPFPGANLFDINLATLCFDISDNAVIINKLIEGPECSSPEPSNLLYEIMPNPAVNYINLRIDKSPDAEVRAEIIDAFGKTISKASNESNALIEFDLKDFTDGLYFVKITSGPYKSIEKVIISK